jgi:hypothetical protein
MQTRQPSAVQPVPTTSGDGHPAPRALIEKYCITCHSERLKSGGLVLQNLNVEDVGSNVEVLEKVVRKLRGGAMPPVGSVRPDPATYARLIEDLETGLDAHAAKAPDPGRPGLHRLNRTEYTNAIRDLLALEIDGKALLPGDNSGYGFDNIADALTVSPGLLERYLLAAKKISRLAVGDPTLRPSESKYVLPYMTLVQDDRMSEDLPLGSRGGAAINQTFPVDGEYEIRIKLQRNSLGNGNRIRGLDVQNQIDLRLDGERLTVFTVGGDPAPGAPAGGRGAAGGQEPELSYRFSTTAGQHVVGVSFNEDRWYVEGVGMSRLPVASDGYAVGQKTERDFGRIEMGLDSVEFVGPFNGSVPKDSSSRREIFACVPVTKQDEAPCARTILSNIARRAYRRPVNQKDTDALMSFFNDARGEGGFDRGIEQGIVRILTDPNFLFRVEQDSPTAKPGTPYRISDLELASRLSFFLWSTIPDDELLNMATKGRLHEPAVFNAQVRRMLADDKAKSVLDNFFGQWLLIRNIATVRPDPKSFPDWDENLRRGFQRETELFLEAQLRDDRPITELLTANYTFLNERVAKHYGIPNIYGDAFRKVTLTDSTRAGLLGQGSILTVTSYPDRTSVVQRGKFIMENILGTPPPPPPAVVPPLEDTKIEGTLRQRMELHRKNPVCAGCHSRMDPLGFAFENFNGIGKFRTLDGGAPVDASGTMPDGEKFDGPAAFRAALMLHSDAFVATLTEKMLTYALGRGVETYDMPTVRAIIRNTAASGNTWSALILNITRSMPFQMRRMES